jgi:alpha-ketoglutarate-dependent taurine dioxygenase
VSELIDAPALTRRAAGPFALDDEGAYRRWRERKLDERARSADDLLVPVADPRALTPAERRALLGQVARRNVAIYASPVRDEDPGLPRALGAQLGLARLDANWLAGEDGVSRIAVAAPGSAAPRAEFIPYTAQAIGWHTDGYYHPPARRIEAMILHAVRAAPRGGDNGLLDPELAYVALRDAEPEAVRALMHPQAMTIPAREDEAGVARPAEAGPVFAVGDGGHLHMRYTARTRSIAWRDDPATRAATGRLTRLLAGECAWLLRVRLEPGMGLVGHNVLHDRSAFVDDSAAPRLLYRARFLDRVAAD